MALPNETQAADVISVFSSSHVKKKKKTTGEIN